MRQSATLLLSAVIIGAAAAAAAQCPDRPANVKWNFQSGDQRVSGDFVAQQVVGRRVNYPAEGGTEHYGSDGSYFYEDASGKYVAHGFRFYRDGSRCLDYPNGPRHDMYVVRDGRFWGLNSRGGRAEARVLK